MLKKQVTYILISLYVFITNTKRETFDHISSNPFDTLLTLKLPHLFSIAHLDNDYDVQV